MIAAAAERLGSSVRDADWVRRTGRISRSIGLTVESIGPAARLGEICEIVSRERGGVTLAEVVGFSDGRVLLMPYEELTGIEVGSDVVATGRSATVPVGREFLGRVVDGFGEPLDGLPPPRPASHQPLFPRPLNPMQRGGGTEVFETGLRAIDSFLTLCRGQRVGIFSGSGVGKSTVLGMLARHTRADVIVVALIGERGREVKAFVDSGLSAEARAQTVVVAATSDQPALVRRRAAFLATAIAEHFRDQGLDTLLVMDSITRVAMAQREIGLASGELPTARGYTPSVFALLPRLLERGGLRAAGGSLTALYSVLVEGDDLSEPISDHVRAILDGHIVLSRTIAQRGRYPAIDVLQSISRLAATVQSREERQTVAEAVRLLAAFEASRDLVEVGAYRAGSNPTLDQAVALHGEIERFLAQSPDEQEPRDGAMQRLRALVAAHAEPTASGAAAATSTGRGR
jgi:flagellum-specific ATP synthase